MEGDYDKVKLTSIISIWADCLCLLPFCIKNHLQFCDGVIVLWSQMSNHGNKSDAVLEYILANWHDSRVQFHQNEPQRDKPPLFNEMMKRNCGIMLANGDNYTHILTSDADEFWDPEIMQHLKSKMDNNPDINGFVHPVNVFIKLPTLWCKDHTLVPGIQRLTSDFRVGSFNSYPYAYDDKGHAHIDPSRRPNTITGIVYSPAPMAHMSYVRKNIDLKIDNSSANLKRSRQVIYDELRDAKPGYISRLYHQPLQSCDNYFNLPVW